MTYSGHPFSTHWCKLGHAFPAMLFIAALASCGSSKNSANPAIEEAFETDGVISRYHTLADNPYVTPLAQHGYIVGIEKSPRANIGVPFKKFDRARLRAPASTPTLGQNDLDLQRKTFDQVTDDRKVMFVSHIVSYTADADAKGVQTHLMYTAYPPSPAKAPSQAYEAGWAQLDELESRLAADLKAAQQKEKPFSHLLFLSMGWNNDQIESVQRYNAIIAQVREAALSEGQVFRPLVIGITWPSVWGGTSVADVANKVLHIGSYGVKARDADEIGFGIANHIMNNILPTLEAQQEGLRTIAIGHSMGARILTRSHYSASMLKSRVLRTGKPPVVIGLQGAFSANRFNEDYNLVVPVRWFFTGEGSPYQNQNTPEVSTALTWSVNDTANPLARLVTGAEHVGGRYGDKAMSKPPMSTKVQRANWEDGEPAFVQACEAARRDNKLLYVDASSIIFEHSDILDAASGKMIWKMITCL